MKSSSRRPRVLIVGYFDRGNLGDDAMRDALLAWLPHWFPGGAELRTARLPDPRTLPVREVIAFIQGLRWADVVMLNGGTYLHDRRSARSLRILTMLLPVLVIARVTGARVAHAGIGIGPVGGRLSRSLAAWTLRLATVTLVRDAESAARARRLQPGARVVVGFDLAILLEPGKRRRLAPRKAPVVGVSIVPHFGTTEDDPDRDTRMVEALASAFDEWHTKASALRVRVFPFFHPPGRTGRGDLDLSRDLVRHLRARGVEAEIVPCDRVRDILDAFADLDAVVATRYHAGLIGYLAGVPMVLFAYEEKCRNLARQIGLPRDAMVDPDGFADAGTVADLFRTLRAAPEQFHPTVPVVDSIEAAEHGLFEFVGALEP